MLKSFLAGSFSGTCSTVLFQPLDLVKTRIQTHHVNVGTHYGMATAFRQVICTDHLIGLWKGMSPVSNLYVNSKLLRAWSQM